VVDPCEHDNESPASIMCWDILLSLRNWRNITKDSAPWSWLVGLYVSQSLT
jgi:hypothetical protein